MEKYYQLFSKIFSHIFFNFDQKLQILYDFSKLIKRKEKKKPSQNGKSGSVELVKQGFLFLWPNIIYWTTKKKEEKKNPVFLPLLPQKYITVLSLINAPGVASFQKGDVYKRQVFNAKMQCLSLFTMIRHTLQKVQNIWRVQNVFRTCSRCVHDVFKGQSISSEHH